MSNVSACPVCRDTGAKQLVVEQQARKGNLAVDCRLVRCGGCTHVYLSPRPTAEQLDAFYNQEYHVFAAGPLNDAELDRFIAAKSDPPYMNHSRVVPGGRFLDVGCGLGEMVRAMQRVGMEARGVEPSRIAAEAARAAGCAVDQGTLREVGYPAAWFDSVSLYHSLEHAPDPVADLAELARIVKPGGHLLIAVPNIDALMFRLCGDDWSGLSLPYHLHHFSESSLRRAVEAAGFTTDRIITESLPSAIEGELAAWSRRRLFLPRRLTLSLHIFLPLAWLLAWLGDRSQRGEALVGQFQKV
jgi:SAM-dependent methyltransferase